MANVQDKDRIAVLRANGYDGVTNQTLSIAKKPERYALELTPRAKRLMRLAFPNDPLVPDPEPKANRPHRDPDMRFRLSDELKEELAQALHEDGYDQWQSGLVFIINMYLVRRRHEENIQQAG